MRELKTIVRETMPELESSAESSAHDAIQSEKPREKDARSCPRTNHTGQNDHRAHDTYFTAQEKRGFIQDVKSVIIVCVIPFAIFVCIAFFIEKLATQATQTHIEAARALKPIQLQH